jgi:hypothetical protein
MARLVIEDSDDEFPDLDELLGKGAGGKNGGMSTMKGGSRDDEELSEEAGQKGKSNGKEKEVVGGKKKRILKRRDDNPLLRPLASTATAAEGRKGKAAIKTSQIPEKEVRIASKKKPVTSFDSEDEAETRTPPKRSRVSAAPPVDFESEEEEISEIKMPPPPKPPRSARKLVKGRKPHRDDEELELDMKGLTTEDEAFDKISSGFGDSDGEEMALPSRSSKDAQSNDNKPPKEAPRPKKKILEPSSDIEDPFTLRL